MRLIPTPFGNEPISQVWVIVKAVTEYFVVVGAIKNPHSETAYYLSVVKFLPYFDKRKEFIEGCIKCAQQNFTAFEPTVNILNTFSDIYDNLVKDKEAQ